MAWQSHLVMVKISIRCLLCDLICLLSKWAVVHRQNRISVCIWFYMVYSVDELPTV